MPKKKSVFKDKAKTKGFSFGLTSGVITTLGMIVGLETATSSKLAVVAGIVSVAIADAFSERTSEDLIWSLMLFQWREVPYCLEAT